MLRAHSSRGLDAQCMERQWTVFTNHAAVLLYLLEHPDATIRRIADNLGLAERTVVGVLHDLRAEGYLDVRKEGRNNVYRVNPQAHMRRPEHAGQTLEQFLTRVLHELEQARLAIEQHNASAHEGRTAVHGEDSQG